MYTIFKDRTFKMSEMVVSWKYEIKTITGEQYFAYFQCLEAIKLEISFQFYLHAMKYKAENEQLKPKIRFIDLTVGLVDLNKFEIETYKTKATYKVIREGNKEPNKRKRPVYSGPEEAIFYECEGNLQLNNQRFTEDFQIYQKLTYLFDNFLQPDDL